MTVGELIEQLKEYPEEYKVYCYTEAGIAKDIDYVSEQCTGAIYIYGR